MGIENMELGAIENPDENIKKIADIEDQEEEKYIEDIKKRSTDNLGAASVLGKLLKEGPEIYDKVAPKLGVSSEIWEKYADECGKDIKVLIEKYGGE